MCADSLSLSYDRAKLLEQIRILQRALKQLSRSSRMDSSSFARKLYLKWYRKLVKLRRRRDIFFPRVSVPAVPFNILQHVYDHHRDFRFTPQQLDLLARELLPVKVQTFKKGRKDVSAEAVVALAVVLRHLATPERQDRQADFWHKSVAWVSVIFHATMDLLYARAQAAFRQWPQFHFDEIPRLCDAMLEKSGNLLYAHSLLDGSGLRVCRPSGDGPTGPVQQHFYSGKERHHVMRILGLFSLSGMLIRLFGTYPGSAADETIYNMEDVESQLGQFHDLASQFLQVRMRPTVIGDSGFTASPNLVTPFSFDPSAPSLSAENVFNMVVSRSRIPNEWGFGRVVNTFQTMQYHSLLKVDWTHPQQQYVLACFFTNFVVIFEGSQTDRYFGVSPPSFEKYIEHINLQ